MSVPLYDRTDPAGDWNWVNQLKARIGGLIPSQHVALLEDLGVKAKEDELLSVLYDRTKNVVFALLGVWEDIRIGHCGISDYAKLEPHLEFRNNEDPNKTYTEPRTANPTVSYTHLSGAERKEARREAKQAEREKKKADRLAKREAAKEERQRAAQARRANKGKKPRRTAEEKKKKLVSAKSKPGRKMGQVAPLGKVDWSVLTGDEIVMMPGEKEAKPGTPLETLCGVVAKKKKGITVEELIMEAKSRGIAKSVVWRLINQTFVKVQK